MSKIILIADFFQQWEVYIHWGYLDIEIGHKIDMTLVIFFHEKGYFGSIAEL